jgi:arginyl-tRNA synthetase
MYGYDVNREYYINDGGNQIEKLALSALIRYKQVCGCNDVLPEDSYHGGEIIDVANKIKSEMGEKYIDTSYDENKILDASTNNFFKTYAKNYLLNIIKNTLTSFGVSIDI